MEVIKPTIRSSSTIIISIAYSIIVYIIIFILYYFIDTNLEICFRTSAIFSLACTSIVVGWYSESKLRLPAFQANCIFYVIAFAYKPDYTSYDPRFNSGLDIRLKCMDMVVLGMLAQLAGYIITTRSFRYNYGLELLSKISSTNLFIIAYFMVAVRWMPVIASSLNDIPSLGQICNCYGLAGISLLLYISLEKRTIILVKLSVIILMLLEFMIRVASGYISQLMLPVMVLTSVYWSSRKRLPILYIIFIISAYLFFAPAKADYRRLTWDQTSEYSSNSRFEKMYLFVELAVKQWTSPRISNDDILDNSTSRFSQLPYFSAVVERTPSYIPHCNGYTFSNAMYSLIPRIFWPDKPVNNLGNSVAKSYGLLDANDDATSFNLPWIVELYMNFGITGVLVGMFVFGIVWGVLEQLFAGPKVNSLDIVIPLSLVMTVTYAESNIVIMWGGLLSSFASLYITCRLFR